MGQPAAKQGDQIVAVDIHIILIQAGPVTTPTPLPHPFMGIINGNLSSNVKIMGMPAATVDSTATNIPPPYPSGWTFSETAFQQGNDKARKYYSEDKWKNGSKKWRYGYDLQ